MIKHFLQAKSIGCIKKEAYWTDLTELMRRKKITRKKPKRLDEKKLSKRLLQDILSIWKDGRNFLYDLETSETNTKLAVS